MIRMCVIWLPRWKWRSLKQSSMPRFFSSSKPAQDLGDGEAELRAEAARGLPAAGAAGRQLHPHPDIGPDADLLRVLENQLQLGVFLDDRDDLPAHLLGQHGHLDELEVLEAVADDRRVVGGERRHGQQLRLAASLEAEAVLGAEVQHLLDDLPLLVDLDGVDAAVAPLVLVLGGGLLEGGVDLAEPVLQDVGEADQDRDGQATELEAIDQALQVDAAAGFLGGMNLQVTVLVDREVALPPARHVVHLAGFGDRPRG